MARRRLNILRRQDENHWLLCGDDSYKEALMARPLFRVKRYAHPKYKFVARGKVAGKWKRRYFRTEDEAIAFAEQQGVHAQRVDGDGLVPPTVSPTSVAESGNEIGSPRDLSRLTSPVYLGPRIERYIGDSWAMHLPFAYDLMREFAPRVFVELGVKQGESYFAFCQSAAENKIGVRCYGVDSWLGDVQTGPLDPKIREQVTEYNWRYSSFSELKPMVFSQAVADFADESIDLLHIDGTHTYHDVKADFESWLPKLSPRGIILFHDVVPRDHGFGVWKVWEEIARPGTSFLFEFGFGLGMWKKRPIGPDDSAFVRRFFRANEDERRRLNQSYATAATTLALWEGLARQFSPRKHEPPFEIEGGERLTEIAQFQREAEMQAERIEQAQRDLEAKTEQILELQKTLEENGTRLAQLESETLEKSKQVARLEHDLEQTSRQVSNLERDASKTSQQLGVLRHENTHLKREHDKHAHSMALAKSQLAASEERLEQASLDVLEAQWEALTLRGEFSRQSTSDVESGRIAELESRVAAAHSDRDHLRAMVSALQKDIESERNRADQPQPQAT